MGGGKLALIRIIHERYTNSEFVFLSACHTAKGGAPPRSWDAIFGVQWGDWDTGRRGRASGGHSVLHGDVQVPGR